jgi:hypothetical protein
MKRNNLIVFFAFVLLPYLVVFLFGRNFLTPKQAIYILYVPVVSGIFLVLKNYLMEEGSKLWLFMGFIILILALVVVLIGNSLSNLNFIM